MKHLVFALGLAALGAAPLAASAQTPGPQDTAAPTQIRFLIVDPQTGRTVAQLVPVDGQPNVLRVIGSVAAPPPSARSASVQAPRLLTIGQENDAYAAALSEALHLPQPSP